MAVRLERRRREVVDTPVELLVSYTNQSIFVARRAVRIRVIVYVLEDLDGVAQIVMLASGTAISGPASHASWRVVG